MTECNSPHTGRLKWLVALSIMYVACVVLSLMAVSAEIKQNWMFVWFFVSLAVFAVVAFLVRMYLLITNFFVDEKGEPHGIVFVVGWMPFLLVHHVSIYTTKSLINQGAVLLLASALVGFVLFTALRKRPQNHLSCWPFILAMQVFEFEYQALTGGF